MAKGPDDTTDKMFPPAEGGLPAERPIPLQPSIRETFVVHHSVMLEQWGAFRAELLALVDARLKAAPTQLTPGTISAKVKAGALTGLRYGGVALALGELAAQVARVAGHPEIAGPLEVFTKLGGG